MPKFPCRPAKRLNGNPLPYFKIAIMLPTVASYFSAPTPSGARAVKTLPQRWQRSFCKR